MRVCGRQGRVADAENRLSISTSTGVSCGIFGLFINLTYAAGALFSLVIWSTAEGFGGPYAAGSSDIGAAIIYVFVFAALFLTSSGRLHGLDRRLGPQLWWFAFLASGVPSTGASVTAHVLPKTLEEPRSARQS